MRKVLLGVTVLVVACGDPATEDPRGYTKAPLESPGLAIVGEPRSPLAGVRSELEPGLVGEPLSEAEPARREAPTDGGEAAGDGGEVTLAEGVSRDQFEQGRTLFSGSGGCMACHGQDGSGGMLGPNLRDDDWLHIDTPTVDAIAGVIRDGVADPQEYPGPMPAMGGASLSDEQVRALAGYVASIAR